MRASLEVRPVCVLVLHEVLGRDDRGVPYHAESTLSGAQVLKLELTLEAVIAFALGPSADF